MFPNSNGKTGLRSGDASAADPSEDALELSPNSLGEAEGLIHYDKKASEAGLMRPHSKTVLFFNKRDNISQRSAPTDIDNRKGLFAVRSDDPYCRGMMINLEWAFLQGVTAIEWGKERIMRKSRGLLNGRIWGAVVLMFVLGITLAWPPPARGVERVLLKYEGGLGGLNLGPYGQASVITKVKGEVWLLSEGGGRWQGIGKMTVRTDAQVSPSPGVKIGPAEAPEANFKVTAAVKAGKLEFWFKSKPIELKGTISFP